MIKVVSSVDINRPVDEVFAFVSNPENDAEWWTGVLESKVISDVKQGVGTTLRQVNRLMGQTYETVFEVTEYEPNRHMTLASKSGPIPFVARYLFEPMDAGRTRFTMDAEVEATGFFKMLKPAFVFILRRQSQGFFTNLKRVLEAKAVRAAV